MKRILSFILCLAMAQCGCPAWADEVSVPDVLPAFEEGGLEGFDLASTPPSGDLAMILTPPPVPDLQTPPARSTLPLSVSAGSGQDTRIGVDLAVANTATDGWPWYGKAAVIVGGVVIAGLATWAIVEATQSHGSTSGDDSGIHVHVPGDGNTINVNSPNYPSTTTTTSKTGGYY